MSHKMDFRPTLNKKLSTIWSSTPPKRTENTGPHKNLHTYSHNSIIYNGLKVGKTQMPINKWIDKQNAVNPNNGISCRCKKEWSTNTCYNIDGLENIMLSEKSQTKKATYCMISFIWNVQNRQNHIDRKQNSGCQEQGWQENGVWLLRGTGFLFEVVIKMF